MTSMIIWVLGIGVSAAALVITAALKQYYLHMAVSALISILVALASIHETRSAASGPATSGHGIDIAMRHMGLVWCWGAISLLVTYAFGVLSWREWWQFFIAFFVLAGLSLFLSATLRKDDDASMGDPTMVRIARSFSIFILVAMVATMVGLLIDGKMWRFTTIAGLRRGSQDWAANNIFFFGALAQAAISWNAIGLTSSKTDAKAA